jgi:hypothetical protein
MANVDPDHALVEKLFPLHPPKDDHVRGLMQHHRDSFMSRADAVVRSVPRSPERTIALRKIHEASQAVITAIAVNQELI